ncbi:MAG TPA: hypothetical protein VNA20_10525 [Frankiaceae bacterium]|nr:hypothetical protein [Frankiaceae bacterium]
MTATAVRVNTAAYATTHVATNVLQSIRQIVREAGLSTDYLLGRWDTLELGIATWLSSRHLQKLTLEIWDPTKQAGRDLVGRFDFAIAYGYYADGDGDLWLDPDTVSYAVRRAGAIPSRCTYRVIAKNAPGAATVAGWSGTSYRSTAGFTEHATGTALGGGSLGVGLSYYTSSGA